MRPKFKNCTFVNNNRNQNDGGAIYIEQAEPIFENCTFDNNSTVRNGGAVAIYSKMIYITNHVNVHTLEIQYSRKIK